MPPPKICDGQKIAQNFSRFLTTSDFDREYLRNGSTYQKLEKLLIIYNPSHVRPKKLAYFLRLPEIDFALGLAAPGGLTSGSAMPV